MDPLHTQMALFRGIENGAALFRPVNGGLSMAADARGRVLAATRGPVMVADLPKWGRRTAYPFLRDLLPWASVAWLLGVAFILSARERPLVG